jgi:hypothetical protein
MPNVACGAISRRSARMDRSMFHALTADFKGCPYLLAGLLSTYEEEIQMLESLWVYGGLALVFGVLGVAWVLVGQSYLTRFYEGHPERWPYYWLLMLVYIGGALAFSMLMWAAFGAISAGPSDLSISVLAPYIMHVLLGIFVSSVQVGIVIAVVRFLWRQWRRLLRHQ